jgi:hypothetical protein
VAAMNLEQYIAGAAFCISFGILAGVLANWWATRDGIKQMECWENELVDREVAANDEHLKAQLALAEAGDHLKAQQALAEAEVLNHEARELVNGVRRGLYKAAADAADADDERADTNVIPVVSDDTVVR